MAGIGTTPSRSVVPKDIRNLRNWTRHDRRGLRGADRPWAPTATLGSLCLDVCLVSQMLRP